MRSTRLFPALALLALVPAAALAAQPIDGHYQANGKDGKLAYLLAQKGEAFHDMPTDVLIFSEKDASHDADPVADARKGDLGDALVVTVVQAPWGWDTLSGYLYHAGLSDTHRADTAGVIKLKDAAVANGEIHGHLVTDAGEKVGDQRIDIDLKFQAKLP